MTAQLEEAVNNMGFMMQHDGRGRQTAWHTLAKLRWTFTGTGCRGAWRLGGGCLRLRTVSCSWWLRCG